MTPSEGATSPAGFAAAPALVARVRDTVLLSPEGEIETLSHADALARLRTGPAPIVCHAPRTAARLGTTPVPSFDTLELFAFTHPTAFCAPTIRGLCRSLDLPAPADAFAEAEALYAIAETLLSVLGSLADRDRAAGIAWTMGQGGWPWAPVVLAGLGVPVPAPAEAARAMRPWENLPEWQEMPPSPPPGQEPIAPVEARRRLKDLLGENAEPRTQQGDYAAAAVEAFAPRDVEGEPNVVVAEAGTGVGKTLGYIAPASLWAERNGGAVWMSTYTRNLQRQLDAELDRLYPDPDRKRRKAVTRKGRENYLCLLNMEEAVRGLALRSADAVALGLMARWAYHSRDGDMVGGDFPAWLISLAGLRATLGLADRRGECIYSACSHYGRCFIERGVRRARRADVVVANHALVMVQAALGGLDDASLPTRYVFDEGHHLFDAADSAFSAHLTGREMAELRRWLLGAEGRRGGRARGLRRRVEDLIGDDPQAGEALGAALRSARDLAATGWRQRINEGTPLGPAEEFLHLIRQQVYARAADSAGPYGIECDPRPPADGLLDRADALAEALGDLIAPLSALAARLTAKLDSEAATLDSATRRRIEAIGRSLQRRALMPLTAWQDMLAALGAEPAENAVDWFEVDRFEGRDLDVGLHRHWIDPTVPFSQSIGAQAHGILITSATLRDGTGDEAVDWAAAAARTGTSHLAKPALRTALPSPFDYEMQSLVLIVTDVRKAEIDQVAAAYRELFCAAGGGGLGLFTSIHRLRQVHRHIVGPLEDAGLDLLAQHVDQMDTGTLVDIFREEADACLLGTDALRDGVDVPGRSLRLIVFDRVPWPRPTILHKARRDSFGGRAYDDMITRLRIKQGFGRLIRSAGDRGVFVLLDSMMPSRLLGAFPPGPEPQRVGLAEAVAQTRAFLASDS